MDIGLIEALQPFDKSFKPLALEAGTVRFGDFPVRKTHAFTRRSRNRGRTTILKLDSKQRNTQSGKPTTTSAPGAPEGRGRDEDFSSPPAQIPACAANAPGSSLGSNVGGAHGLKPHALRRTVANRIDVVARLSVRTTAACRLFPSGEALPSTTSAGSCLPLFGRFLGTTTSSDFSSAYMLGVRLLPSRAGPAQVRARVRPPRFRAKNFSTCTRSPTARGSSHASHSPWDDVAFSSTE